MILQLVYAHYKLTATARKYGSELCFLQHTAMGRYKKTARRQIFGDLSTMRVSS